MGGIVKTEPISSSMTTGYIGLLSRRSRRLTPEQSPRGSQERRNAREVDLASDSEVSIRPRGSLRR